MNGAKPLRIKFDKVNGLIRVYGGTIYLVLFSSGKNDAIYNSIRNLISQKRGTNYLYFWQLCKNQSWFVCFFFTSRKKLSLHDVIIPYKSDFKKN